MNVQYSNKASKISLFLGISSIPLLPFLIPSIAGLICGIKGIKKANQQAGYGKAPSLIGLILSSLSLFGFMLIIPIMIFMDSVSPLAKTVNKGATHENSQQDHTSETFRTDAIENQKNIEVNDLQPEVLKEEFMKPSRLHGLTEAKKKEADTPIDEPYKEPAFPPCLMARKYQAATGIYTKNDILHLKITEEEREELLNLHIKAEHQKQNDDPRASDRRLSEKSCLAAFSQREQAFFVFKKRFLNIMSGEGTYRFPLLESLIKPTLHDPASFEHVSLTCKFKKGKKKTDLGQIILQEAFRGKNALGNKAINYAVVVYDYDKDTFLDEKAATSIEPSFQGTLIEDVQRHQVENPQ